MKKRTIAAFLFIVLLFSFAACSSDDDSGPTATEGNGNTEPPATVGTYTGTNSMDTTMTVVVSNIEGKAFVTSFTINIKNSSGRGSLGGSSSSQLAEVVNNSFSYSLGNESDEKLTGTISGNTMTGSFKYPPQPLFGTVSGTFSITKQ